MQTFQLEIITPTRVVLGTQARFVTVPTKDGTIGVLPNHISLCTALSEGEIKVVQSNKETYLAIGGGFMEVFRNTVTILVSRAVHAEELNEAEIKKAQESAQAVIKTKGQSEDRAQAQAIMRRSILEMKVLRRTQHKRTMPGMSQ